MPRVSLIDPALEQADRRDWGEIGPSAFNGRSIDPEVSRCSEPLQIVVRLIRHVRSRYVEYFQARIRRYPTGLSGGRPDGMS
jgi:hypothetical protein